MNGYMHHITSWPGIPFYGLGLIMLWLIFVTISFLVYQDAKERGMNGALWFVLIILPVIGILFLFTYLVIVESQEVEPDEEEPLKTLKERYARSEIDREEFLRIKEDILK